MSDDDLFLERLKTLHDKHLIDLKAFSIRENRPYENVRLHVIQWLCDEVFSLLPLALRHSEGRNIVTETLRRTSDSLELLEQSAGFQSFFLVINPKDPKDEGFLGGTLLGREFWRNHRGCGSTGAQAFRFYCSKAVESPATTSQITQQTPYISTQPSPSSNVAASTPKSPANITKSEVYTAFRNAIRLASGQRNAEMKWTNHEKLSIYGIRIEGWPSHIPQRNPSALSTAQNKEILECVQSGAIRFPRLLAVTPANDGSIHPAINYTLSDEPANAANEDGFSWTYKSHDTTSNENMEDYLNLNDTTVSASVHLDPSLVIGVPEVETAEHARKRRRLDSNGSPNG